ncbi:hypothetical protein PCANC_11030 [Puccinia coronata f. sp. avenae]|uniref:Uncharacterized protein n=1 Tax=Puccinia coronata f. sp. avenae TaxID=200324 RepID=A0A2N5USW9_9BASI|nr:hypothetical protein PCANC_11030 [Puccinia coronata f. sp. avenae]
MARMIMDGSNSSPSNVLSSSYILKSIKYPNSNPFNRPDNASFGRPVHPRDRRLEIAQGFAMFYILARLPVDIMSQDAWPSGKALAFDVG